MGPRLGQPLPILPLVPLAPSGLVAVRSQCPLPRLGGLVARLVRTVYLSLGLVTHGEGLCS